MKMKYILLHEGLYSRLIKGISLRVVVAVIDKGKGTKVNDRAVNHMYES